MDNVRITYIKNIEELDQFSEEWDDLLEVCDGSSPLQSYAWTKAYFNHYIAEKKTRWICLFAHQDDQMVAVYPLIFQKSRNFPGIHFQWFHQPYDIFHTVRTDGLILPGYEFVLQLFVNKIRSTLKVFPIIQISKIPVYSASYRSLANQNLKLNLQFLLKPSGNEEFIESNISLEEYILGLNAKFRSELRRKTRRLEESFRITYIFGYTGYHERCLDQFIKLEDSGWKGHNNTSLKKRGKDQDLFKKGTGYLHEKGWIEWNFLKADNKIIAAQMHIKKFGVSFLWKTAYNEDFSDYSPGNILLFKYFQNAIQKKLYKEINFLNERKWFERWNVKKRKLYNVIIFPKAFLVSNLIKIYYKLKYS